MTKDIKTIEPQPKLIWPYLAWTFGWSWGFWLLCILLKNLWPENPPMPYLVLKELLFTIGVWGPLVASLIVLKKRGLKAIVSFIFSGRRGTWLWFLIYGGALIVIYALASSGRLVDSSILVTLPLPFIIAVVLGGGMEEPGWRGFLQPALEKRFPFPLATVLVGIVWAIWHIPFWFYRPTHAQIPFLLFLVHCLVVAFWLSALYKKTRSVIACNVFHVLINVSPAVFIGMVEVELFGDLSKINPFFYLGGVALLTLFSIYHWYRMDKEEKTEVT